MLVPDGTQSLKEMPSFKIEDDGISTTFCLHIQNFDYQDPAALFTARGDKNGNRVLLLATGLLLEIIGILFRPRVGTSWSIDR